MSDQGEGGIPVRRYEDAEVRQLLERATRAQTSAPARRQTPGLTLAELEDIAAEAHIDVARLRAAAHELELERTARPAGAAARLAGGPLRMRVERVLPFEVDDTALHRLVMTIGAASGDDGEPHFVGRTFTWTVSTNSGRRTTVRISAHDGRTSIQAEERYRELAGGLFGGVLGGVGGGLGFGAGGAIAGTLGSAALAVAIPVTVIAGTYAACRFGFRAYVRKRTLELDRLCDHVANDLAESRAGRTDSRADGSADEPGDSRNG
jgi:hypothetical protein